MCGPAESADRSLRGLVSLGARTGLNAEFSACQHIAASPPYPLLFFDKDYHCPSRSQHMYISNDCSNNIKTFS